MKTWRQPWLKKTLQSVAAGAALLATAAGCASHSSPPGPIPVGTNPADGSPNHMTPEMQAQIQHYQSVGGK